MAAAQRSAGESDGTLGVADATYKPIGREAGRWAGFDEFSAIADQFGRSHGYFGMGSADGLSLESSFGMSCARILLRHDLSHPGLGSRLLAFIALPAWASSAETTETCRWPSRFAAIARPDSTGLGAWHPRTVNGETSGPASVERIPSALYAEGLPTNLTRWCANIARWAPATFWPHLVDWTMQVVLTARFAGLAPDGHAS